MRFTAPYLLLLLLLVPLCAWGAYAWLRRSAHRLAALSRHAASQTGRARLQVALLLITLILGAIAAAGPRWGTSEEYRAVRGRNVMLAVDVSRSMLAEDIRPNRLGRAKADLIDLIDTLKGDRAGVLAFRGKGVLLCPMTTDTAFLRQAIDALEPDSAPPGETNLADAIAKCLSAFERAESSHNAVILISDGESLSGDTESLAKQAAAKNIPIFTVGIGSAEGAVIPDRSSGTLRYQGKEVRSRLDEATLKKIADISGGAYVPLAKVGSASTTLGAVYARYLTRLADREARERVETAFADRTVWFAVPALLCLLAAGILSLGRLSRPRAAAKKILPALALLILPALVSAAPAGVTSAPVQLPEQPEVPANTETKEEVKEEVKEAIKKDSRFTEPAREAQAAWRKGDYKAAAEGYRRARAGAEVSEAAHYAFNEALAERKAGQTTNALDAIRLAARDERFAVRAGRLEGTLLLEKANRSVTGPADRARLKSESAAAFARALRASNEATDRRNLARALDDLEQARRDARREEALKVHGKKMPGQLLPEILMHQRQLARAVPEVYSGSNLRVRIHQADQLAKDVRSQSDRWFPMYSIYDSAVTNATQKAQFVQMTQQAQADLDTAARGYERMQKSADPLWLGESFAYNMWKTFATPDLLLNEAIAVQTNALTKTEAYIPTRKDLPEVRALTEQFHMTFPNWAEEQLKQAATTNAVQFTKEDRDIIVKTVAETLPLLKPDVVEAKKQTIMNNLNLVREHMPKNQNQQNQQQQQQQQQQQDKQQQQQDKQDQKDQQQNQDQQQDKQEQSQDQQQDEQSAKEEDMEATLRKAEERERDKEREKRARIRPTRPNARDW